MRQIDTVRRFSQRFDSALESARAEFVGRASALETTTAAVDADKVSDALRASGRGLESMSTEDEVGAFGALEAIILEKLRPAYLISGDRIQIHGDYDRQDLVEAHKPALEKIARGVGRIDLFHHSTLNYAGTGWLISEDVAITNRHVANIFAQASWDGYEFRLGAFGERMEARLDYIRQHQDFGLRRRADVLDVLYIAAPREPDIALLKVETRGDVEPLEFYSEKIEDQQPVAVVGYPASDGGRNDPALMRQLFNDIYDVKRFAPGLVTGHSSDGILLMTDYTSLGGNSGSPILDLVTGKAVGLHFSGAFKESNYAVAAPIVAAATARMRTLVAVPEGPAEEAPTSAATEMAGRSGYDPDFLGSRELSVPLPGLGNWSADVAPVSDEPDGVLKYCHFSVIQSASRRLPLVTAGNIDGARAFRLKRVGEWRLDGRLSLDHQIGNELYRSNRLDRGHMVRRRDPGWGDTKEEAQQGEIDTFHYTNSVPQHEDLNQKDWVGLEDYIMDAAETRDFKVSVLTGPVFRDDDPRLRHQPGAEDIPIPREFWKIAVMVNDDTGELSATGYVLSQGDMIKNLTEAAFVLGKYETYQIQIARIEEATGLDFGRLRDFDPMGAELDTEAPFAQAVQRIEGPGDLRL